MALQKTRAGNYPEWFQNVITAADMAELSATPGCMVIKPWGLGIWERIRFILNEKIKETGHENCYFPLFIPLSFFQKEAEHVDGFAKEMAVVTHSRLTAKEGKLVPDNPLDEPLVVRPTSEAIIADSFSKWVKSYRDLPVMVNQWANVVRWEMRPRLFLRTREFMWQEGHTAHADYAEAEAETINMLSVYADLAENYLALPVIKGRKPAHEKFPGAVDTYCIEAMMQDGRALQAGTSHFLGQNFAKSANIRFQNKEGGLDYAYTTSWGVSTRLVGGVIMTHGDDEGLCVPPKIAPYQVVIVPILKDSLKNESVMTYAAALKEKIAAATYDGERVRVKVDTRLKDATDKYWEWTRKGAPLILEVGPRDVDKNGAVLRTRVLMNTPEWKQIVAADEFVATVSDRLTQIQEGMLARARVRLNKNIVTNVQTPEEMQAYFANQNIFLDEAGNTPTVAFVRGKWCGDEDTLEMMKTLKISVRCVPFDQSGTTGKCLMTGREATLDVIYARAY